MAVWWLLKLKRTIDMSYQTIHLSLEQSKKAKRIYTELNAAQMEFDSKFFIADKALKELAASLGLNGLSGTTWGVDFQTITAKVTK
jgi:hypothetical protein